MFERQPDGRRKIWMLKDGSHYDRIEKAEKLSVAYTRFSSHLQNEETTETQLKVIFKKCEEEGTAIAEVYSDEGRSGTTDRRKEFQRMVSALESRSVPGVPRGRMVDYLTVYKLDRYSRGEYDADYYRYVLAKVGTRVRSATELIPEAPEGIFVEKNIEAAAVYYSRLLSIRVKDALEAHALDRKTNGVFVPGYKRGEDGRFELDYPLCYHIRAAIEQLGEGITLWSVENKMKGIKDSRGKEFDAKRIARLTKKQALRWGVPVRRHRDTGRDARASEHGNTR